ncbi:hypothetical protein D3C80_1868600 [compost metagenome]
MLREGTRRERDLDADAAEEADDGLGNRLVIDIAVVRRVERDGKAVRITGFGKQRLGLGDIGLRVGIQLFRPAMHEGRHDDTGRDRVSAQYNLLQRVPVDRKIECLAYPHVVQRVLVLDV